MTLPDSIIILLIAAGTLLALAVGTTGSMRQGKEDISALPLLALGCIASAFAISVGLGDIGTSIALAAAQEAGRAILASFTLRDTYRRGTDDI
jgi:hypothetical protein